MNKQQEKIMTGAYYRSLLKIAFGTQVTVNVVKCTKTHITLSTNKGQFELHFPTRTNTIIHMNGIEIHNGTQDEDTIVTSIQNTIK